MHSSLPPIPILVLLILIGAWIVPLLISNIRRADFAREPRTEAQLRKSFYWRLLLTVGWVTILMLQFSRADRLDKGMRLLIVALGIFVTIWRFRLWRYHSKNLGQ